MINKENVSKGKDFEQLHVNNYGGYVQIETSKYYGQGLDLLDCEHVGIKQAEANGELFVEAFKVFSKTGMTPEELANFHKGYKSHLSKHGSPQTYYVAKCSELEKQIEQLQQENDEQRRLLKKIEDGIASSIKNDIPVSVFMQQQLKNIQSLTTQQEQNK